MHNRSARSLLVVCTLQLLLIGVSAAPLADGLNPLGDFERMDAALENELNSVDDHAVLSVIFQLNSEVLPEDLLHFEELGAEILGMLHSSMVVYLKLLPSLFAPLVNGSELNILSSTVS